MTDEKNTRTAPPELLPDIAAEAALILERELRKTAREPFKRALQRMLGFRPTAEALQAFANKSPDRWALAVSTLAGLAGYEKGININVRVKNVNDMSDMELLEEHRLAMAKVEALARGIRTGEVVDAEVLPSLPESVGGDSKEKQGG